MGDDRAMPPKKGRSCQGPEKLASGFSGLAGGALPHSATQKRRKTSQGLPRAILRVLNGASVVGVPWRLLKTV